jgi:ribulose-phosphate 3-epimerase
MKIEKMIAPSLLSADFSNLKSEIISLGDRIEYLHLDVMDGAFVPNITFGPIIIKGIVKAASEVGNFKFDTHLMINNPDNYIEDFAKAGSDIITVHAEALTHIDRTISLIKSFDKKAGLSLNPATPCNVLKYVIQKLDLVLVMSVNPGFGGQSFIEYTLEKIRRIKKLADEYNPNLIIEVDGGIKKENIKSVYDAGANLFVAGSSVFGKQNRIEAINDLELQLK